MKRLLLLLPLVAVITACSKPPEITAANMKQAAMACLQETQKKVERIRKERKLAESRQHLLDSSPEDFWENIKYPHLISHELERVILIRHYCRQKKLKWPGLWRSIGSIEYLVTPDFGDSEVKHTILSYRQVWKEALREGE